MKRTTISTLITVVLCFGQTPVVRAATTVIPELQQVLITEIQTGGSTDATEEFVELYNPNEDMIDVAGWQLQYRAASGTAAQNWSASSTKATIACSANDSGCTTIMQPYGRIVLVRTIFNIADAFAMTGGFGDAGGEIRLVKPISPGVVSVQDLVGYGTALDAEGSPAPAPIGGSSIKRKLHDNNIPMDTNNNSADFISDCGSPTPGIEDTAHIPFATGCTAPQTEETPPTTTDPETPNQEETTAEDPEPAAPTPTYLPIIITELLPDPAAPQQDSNDEFIELYNPNDTAVTLQEYRLQTGSNYRYTYTLGDTPLGPHMYLAIPSAVSKLSLVNSGSGVRLIDPGGTTVNEITYGDAKEGQAWAYIDSNWQWTVSPTPGTANVLTAAAVKTSTATATTKKKATTTSKTATPNVTAPKATTAKKTTNTNVAAQPAAVAQSPQYWLLIPIGTLAAGYAAYEYRQDMGKMFRKAWGGITKNNKTPTAEGE